jgi:hypothetical protein
MMACDDTWRSLFNEIEQTTQDIAKYTNQILDELRKVPTWAWYTPGIADKLWAGRWMAQGVVKLLEYFEPRLNEPGNPCVIERAALALVNDVGKPLTAETDWIDPGYYDRETKWKGVASDAYKSLLLNQRNACTAMKTTSDAVAGQLMKIRSAIKIYWWAVAAALAVCVLAILAALAASKGGPKGVAAGIIAVIAAVGAAAFAISQAENNLDNALDEARVEIAAKATDGALNGPDNGWPTLGAGFDMSDGSIQVENGQVKDDTDWHMK